MVFGGTHQRWKFGYDLSSLKLSSINKSISTARSTSAQVVSSSPAAHYTHAEERCYSCSTTSRFNICELITAFGGVKAGSRLLSSPLNHVQKVAKTLAQGVKTVQNSSSLTAQRKASRGATRSLTAQVRGLSLGELAHSLSERFHPWYSLISGVEIHTWQLVPDWLFSPGTDNFYPSRSTYCICFNGIGKSFLGPNWQLFKVCFDLCLQLSSYIGNEHILHSCIHCTKLAFCLAVY